jgi:hypothetical protein
MPNRRLLLRVCPAPDYCVISRRFVTAIAAFIAAFASVLAHAGTNQWTTNGPYGGLVTVLAVDPQTPANLYAAGFSGVFKSSDGGDNWALSSNGITNPSVDALAIDPVTPTTLYAAMLQGQIAKSIDGAATWSTLSNSPSLVTAMAINPQATGTIYAGQDQNGLQKTTDGGATWSSIGAATLPTFPTFKALIVDPATPTTIYAGESSNGIFKSLDGGATWAAANTGMTGPIFQVLSMAIDPKTPSTLYAVVLTSGNPGLFKSTDGAGTWTNILANGTNIIETVAVDPKTPSTIYVGQFVSTGASALISTDGGATFTPIQTGLPSRTSVEVFAINPVSPATLYAGTNNGIYKTTNSGGAWSETINGLALTDVTAVAVDPATPATIYAGTSASGLFKSIDGGGSWASINTGIGSTGNADCLVPNYTALAIDPVSTTTLYASAACTQSSGVFKSIDGGAHWTVAATGLPLFHDIYGLAIDPTATSTIYAAAGNGGLYQSTNGAASWSADSELSLPEGNFGVTVGAINTSSVAAVAARRASVSEAAQSTAQAGVAPAGAPTPVVVTFGGNDFTYKVDGGTPSPVSLENDCPQLLAMQVFAGLAEESVNQVSLYLTCVTLLLDRLQNKNSNGYKVTYVVSVPQSATKSTSAGARTSARLRMANRARSLGTPIADVGPTPETSYWGPPNGSNADAAACNPATSIVGNPLDPTGASFYAGAACGVLSAINGGLQIVTMNNGLPPNLQINAVGITPAGDVLYAGATNGGVYQFVLAAQTPTQVVFANVNSGLSPTAGVPFNVVVRAAAADLSAQNVASDTTVQLSLATGIGMLGGGSSCVIPAGSSQCTVIGVTYSVADTGVVLTATRTAGDALTPGNSPPFSVVVAEAPTQLAIVSANGGANPVAGAAFNVVIAAEAAADSSSQNVVTATTVQLSVSTGVGTLGGTTTCVIPAGSSGCTVVGVTYSQVDTGVVLTATRTAGDSLTPGNSAPFNVVAVSSKPTATTTTATAIAQTGATLNGTVSANGAPTAVTFGYGLSNAYGTNVTAAQSPLAGGATNAAVSAAVTGLTCNTLYHFHVVANNGTGGNIDGGDLTFTTSACAAPPTTTITGGPTNPSNVSSPQFTFTSSQPGSTFQCQLDGGAINVCSSPTTVQVGNGTHTFEVQAIGAGNNVDPVGASFTWLAQDIANNSTPVPTMSKWTLVLLALLIGSAGAYIRRRKAF